MSRLSVLARPARAPGERRPAGWPKARWLIPLCYLLGAMVVTLQLWVHPTSQVPSYGDGGASVPQPDIVLNLWFMRYIATAVAHGHLPALVTTSLNWPQGVNMMWNTSLVLPGVVLTPVTLLSGPATSLVVLLAAGFFLSAVSMYVVLRRWGASISAAFIGGAFYGFSPALRMAAPDHYHLQFAALSPLIVDALLRLLTGRGRPVRTGIWLGVLAAAQLFTAEEPLVDTVVAAAMIIIVMAVSNVSRIRLSRIRLSLIRAVLKPAAGLSVALAVALLLSARALWVQFVGPVAEHGSPWRVSKFGNTLSDFVSAPVGMVFHGQSAPLGAPSVEDLGYVGWPLLFVLAAAIIFFWRDSRIRVAGVAFFLLELLSIGDHAVRIGRWHLSAAALPWHWLVHLPLFDQALPNRLSIAADGAAAAVLAFAIDQAKLRLPAGRLRLLVPVAAALVLLPAVPLWLAADTAGGPPASWQRVLADLHLPAGAPVLAVASSRLAEMQWQAISGEPITIVGGFCITSAPTGNSIGLPPGSATVCSGKGTLTSDQLAITSGLNHLAEGKAAFGPGRSVLATAMAEWRPAALITTDAVRGKFTRYLLRYFGPPDARSGQVLGWRVGAPPEMKVGTASCSVSGRANATRSRCPTAGSAVGSAS